MIRPDRDAQDRAMSRLEHHGAFDPPKKRAKKKKTSGNTTPSGRVAASQRAKAAKDTPLKNTTQKKPPSGKNEASGPTVAEMRKRAQEMRGGPLKTKVLKELEGRPDDEPAIRPTSEKYRADPEAVKAARAKTTTPSGSVAAKQRAKAVADSPLKSTPTKAPRPSKAATGRAPVGTSRGGPKPRAADPKPVSRRSPAGGLKGAATPPQAGKSTRKLSMDPKQVARRAKRGFPSGH